MLSCLSGILETLPPQHIVRLDDWAQLDEFDAKLPIGLRKAGRTYQEIATMTGLNRTVVFDICKRYGPTGAGTEGNEIL